MAQYRFGTFKMGLSQRRLVRADGAVVVLAPRLFDALEFLVARRRTARQGHVARGPWPGFVVEQNSLSQTVSALRRVLDDDAQAASGR